MRDMRTADMRTAAERLRRGLAAVATFVTLWLLAAGVRADLVDPSTAVDEVSALKRSEAAIGRELGNYVFRDSELNTVSLSQFRGKPLLVNLVYTGCSRACPLTIERLSRAVEVAAEAIGPDSFSVFTIGFDAAADTPQRMRAFARDHGIVESNWRFLSGDRATIDALAQDLGFSFFSSAQGFEHLAQTTVVDENGRVYRQIYGADFEPPALVEPLKDLVFGRKSDFTSLSGILNRIRLFCTLYDPASGRYTFDYSVFVGIVIGFIIFAVMGILLVRSWLRSSLLR